jgi:hypothetical protein
MPAYYSNFVKGFLSDSTDSVLGALTTHASADGPAVDSRQIDAWLHQIDILKVHLSTLKPSTPGIEEWGILFEYKIPRRSKRIDTVLIAGNMIVVIEFKIGSNAYDRSAVIQVEDYCLDLRDFHSESKDRTIIPILLSSEAPSKEMTINPIEDSVQETLFANKKDLDMLLSTIRTIWPASTHTIPYKDWEKSAYNPTPTIIEAAQALYGGHDVYEISRSHAGAENLTKTSEAIVQAIRKARKSKSKIICFITGVPGSGKTLAGLNIVHNPDLRQEEQSLGVLLSGNGPLVKVLQEALARDHHQRTDSTLANSRRHVQTFLQNVHIFIEEYFADNTKVPVDHVALWDEAQRAWNAEQSQRKFNRNYSEAEIMLEIMDRHDWAVIVALVGGGQEINTGEAGLPEWGKTVAEKYPHWKVYISPELVTGAPSTAGLTLFEEEPKGIVIEENPDLHLRVAIRAYKAQELSRWVEMVLSGKSNEAREIFHHKLKHYPIYLTRSLHTARNWLKSKVRGTRRVGLVASSGARRLRRYGMDVTLKFDVAKWFLNPADDVRSSYYLEIPATEFAIQGLELDWVGVCWGADFRREHDTWGYYAFKGTTWQTVRQDVRKQFILNKYRVLLTRSREGMIIWVPKGSPEDKTDKTEFYEQTAQYLLDCGLREK